MTRDDLSNLDLDLDLPIATELVRAVAGDFLTVTAIRPMRGGSINQVLELTTDGEPRSIIAKINDASQADVFTLELASLEYFANHTGLPVPKPLGLVRGPRWEISGLLMERVPGTILSHARFSPTGQRRLQAEIAAHLTELHRHTRSSFGVAAIDPGHDDWLAGFGPKLQAEFEQVRDQLSSSTRAIIDGIVTHLDRYLPRHPTPTLTHGDLWANNMIVDDADPDRPRINAFIDGFASFCHVEYELAYLNMFHTVDRTFYKHYTQRHPIEPGFDRRSLVYWLHTMLLHVRVFGEKYVPRCESVAAKLAR